MKHKVQPEEAHYVIDAGRERILGVFYFLQDYVVCLFIYLCTIFKAKLNYSINIEREIKSIYCSLQLLWTQTTLACCLGCCCYLSYFLHSFILPLYTLIYSFCFLPFRTLSLSLLLIPKLHEEKAMKPSEEFLEQGISQQVLSLHAS